MKGWQKHLRFDPLPPLLTSKNEAIRYFSRRDLLNEQAMPIESLWRLPEVERLVEKQLPTGAWKYPGGEERLRTTEDYNQIETYRTLGILIEKYSMNRKHPAIQKAAEYLFTRQTEEGDFRGIYGNQYTPNYTAAITELLTKAQYDTDPRTEEAFNWLLSIRQNDGGWAIPLRTAPNSGTLTEALNNPRTIKPDRSKPFFHCITGIVLRAFAAHRKHRRTDAARTAGKLLKSRFFQPDKYPDRKAPSFWTKFSFPFWFTDLLSALDSLSTLGFSRDDPQIRKALQWLTSKQQQGTQWKLPMLRTKDKELTLWISLATCRMLKRCYTAPPHTHRAYNDLLCG